MKALGQLAAQGEERAAVRAATLMRELLAGGDVRARAAALDAIAPSDAADPELVRLVVSALDEPRLAGAAGAAVRRLGEAAVPYIVAALAADDRPGRAPLVRAAATLASEHGYEVVAPALDSSDRTTVLAALEALDAAHARDLVPPRVVETILLDATGLASRASAARADLVDADDSLMRALDDEIDLARRVVIAALSARYGERVLDAVRVVDHSDGQRRALGVEALDVLLTRAEAAVALPLVRRDALAVDDPAAREREEWIADFVDDPEGVWRSEWLAICARNASGR
jgi:hypothetical protein